MAQMESRNSDRGLWKRKLKITEQLKKKKKTSEGLLETTALRERERERHSGIRIKKMRGHKSKPDGNHRK